MTSIQELQTLILTTLDAQDSIPDTTELREENGESIDFLKVLGALNSLLDKEMVKYDTIESEFWTLTAEGTEIADTGSHEAKVFEAIPVGDEGITISELQNLLGEAAKIGQGKAFKNKWIAKNGNKLLRTVDSIIDQTRLDLEKIRSIGTHSDPKVLNELKKRKLCDKQWVVILFEIHCHS
ncbi:9997_t:CDS:2 [Ambispora gerdemannii]|uniref:9997_t:CDS:1 n=1 Tax=Ambispora gerdemannii TaxID=144530 RepID=A0A9N8YQD0_9GLOM|nr:9997_t:CDS:2 [Ambispora gerdemannii]